MWKPGQSGNPRGYSPEDRKLKLLCRQYTERAITKIVAFLDSDNPMVALSAAKEILDRGYGKPKQVLEGKFEHEHSVNTGESTSLRDRLGQRSHRDSTPDTVQ